MSEQQASGKGGPTSFVEDSSKLYVHGNLSPRRTSTAQSEWAFFADGHLNPAVKHDAGWPFAQSNVSQGDAESSYDELILHGVQNGVPTAGATPRDLVDARAISDVANRTGGWISDPSEGSSGGLPSYDPGTPRPDEDDDGMPDSWEQSHGLDPNDPEDAHLDRDGDGYRNIEEYINSFFFTL